MAEPRTTWRELGLDFRVEDHWVRVSTSAGVLVGHISPVVRTLRGAELDLREPRTNRLAWCMMARLWMQRLEHETSRSKRPSKWFQ